MTTVMPAQCFACTRLHTRLAPGTGTPVAGTCDAFPSGIPYEIKTGADHREPRGDEVDGLAFNQLDTADGHEAFLWWQKTFAASQPE